MNKEGQKKKKMMSDKVIDMLEEEGVVVSLEQASWPAEPTDRSKIWDKNWLSEKEPMIREILTLSFDRMKELCSIEDITSFDAFFYNGGNGVEDKTSFLFEFKDTDSKNIINKFLADKTSDKKYKDSINRKIRDSAKILQKIEFYGINGEELIAQTHVVIVYREDRKGPVRAKKKLKDAKPVRGEKRRATGASTYSPFQEMLGTMQNPKEIMEESFGKDAKDKGFMINKADLHQMQVNLGRTSQSVGYKEYELKKKSKGYVTVLNRDEFAKVFQQGRGMTFLNWNWGDYSGYFKLERKLEGTIDRNAKIRN